MPPIPSVEPGRRIAFSQNAVRLSRIETEISFFGSTEHPAEETFTYHPYSSFSQFFVTMSSWLGMGTVLVKQFEALWESGDNPPDVFSFLQQHCGSPGDDVLGVVLLDQNYRWNTEAPYTVEDYIDRLPDLDSQRDIKLQLAIGEYQAHVAAGTSPNVDEYTSRFSDISEQLLSELSGTAVVDDTVTFVVEIAEIDKLCNEFEKIWADGGEPSLDEFLANCPDASRGPLLTELLQVELGWRRKRSEQPEIDVYCSRYPQYVDDVRLVFGHLPADPSVAPTFISPDNTKMVRRKLDDRQYRVLNEVARGGMGVVHRVWDDSLGRHVAMKVIRGDDEMGSIPVDSVDASAYLRFVREAEITGQLDHPGVVPIHELGVDEKNRTYFTMRLIDGDNLHHIYQLVKDKQSTWNQTRAVGVIVNVCDTIAFAHSRKILHRDLKPSNVMVGQFGETYVMDWGLAKAGNSKPDRIVNAAPGKEPDSHAEHPNLPHDDETMDGSVLGTPAYMPPEQAAGRIGELDGRSDVFSIGAMLYELLAGNRPYKDLDPPPSSFQLLQAVLNGAPTGLSVLSPKCPPELVAVCEKAMARSKNDRYQTAQEMSEDLRAYLEGRVVRAHRTGPWAELKKWIGRNRGLATAMVSAVLIAVCGLVAVISLERSKNEELKTANEKTINERNYAQSLYLAQRSIDAVETDPALALLLAKESLQRDTNPTTRTAFYTAAGSLDEKKTLIGHSDEVWRAEFSPDGTRVVTASDDATTALWDVASGERLAVWRGHRYAVRAVAWSPDGKLIASAGHSGVIVRDADTGIQKWKSFHSGSIWTLDFSPDGSSMVSASSDGTCAVWDVESGRSVKVYEPGAPSRVARFSPDGSLLAAGTSDGTIHIYEMDSRLSRALIHADGGVELLQFSESGDRLMTSDRDLGGKIVYVWNPHTAKQIAVLEHESPVTAAAMTNDGEVVVTGQENGRLTIWSVSDAGKQHVHEFGKRVRFIDISVDNRQLVTCAGHEIHCIGLADPNSVKTLKGHGNKVLRASLNNDASLVLTCSDDRTARLWAIGTHRLVPRLEFGRAGFPGVKFTAEGDILCWVYGGESALLWSPAAPTSRPVRGLQHSSNVLRTIPLQSGVIVTHCRDTVHFWREDGIRLKSFQVAGDSVTAWASTDNESVLLIDRENLAITELSADGEVVQKYSVPSSARQSEDPLVWLVTMDGAFRVHHLRTGIAVNIPAPSGHRVLCNANGCVVTGPDDGSHPAQLWSMETGDCLATLEESSDPLANASIVADGTRVLATSLPPTGAIRVWNAQTGERLPDLSGHVATSPVRRIALPNSQKLITIDDNAVRMWDIASGTPDRGIAEHLVTPPFFALSADGQFFAVPGDEANTVKVWRLQDFELWCVLPTRRPARLLQFNDSNDLIVADAEGRFDFWPLTMHFTPLEVPREFFATEAETLELTSPDR